MTRLRQFTPGFKGTAEGCREHRSQPQVVNRWKRTFLEQARTVFARDYGQTVEQQRIAEPWYCDRNGGLVYNVTMRPQGSAGACEGFVVLAAGCCRKAKAFGR